jgi:hypothetical protein
MIPIECPKCGRKGKAPSDRLKTRLVCKACHAVFHFDAAGHMILGEPESPEPKHAKPQAEVSSAIESFDFAKTWDDIPKPVRYGVPAILLSLIIWLNLGPGESTPGYFARADSIIRALASNDRSRVVSSATSDSAEAAGKWFDLWHGELEKRQFGSNIGITPNLLAGDPNRDSALTLMMVVSKDGGTDATVTILLPMTQVDSSWKMDGNKGLATAETGIAAAKAGP